MQSFLCFELSGSDGDQHYKHQDLAFKGCQLKVFD